MRIKLQFLTPLFALVIIQTSSSQTISAGGFFSLVVCPNGIAQAWGDNFQGELGNPLGSQGTPPAPVVNLTGILTASAGFGYSLAIKNDGTIWSWGQNYYGQLGDSTTTQRNTPVLVHSLTNVISVSAGTYHSLALKNDSTVWAWGQNAYGQLGTVLSYNPCTTAVQTNILNGIIKIATGSNYSIALKSDGTVWTWGNNNVMQLGDSITVWRIDPTIIPSLSGITSIVAGFTHGIALKNNGTVWAWGWNHVGELGDGTFTPRGMPVQVLSLTGVTEIAAGQDFSVALKNDGTVWTWGENQYGQLGVGDTIDSNIPIQVSTLSGITSISAKAGHVLALKNDGTLWAWGFNGQTQVNNTASTAILSPVEVIGYCTFVGINELVASATDPLITPTLTNGEFSITFSHSVKETPMSIYNSLGEKVYEEIISGTSGREIHMKNIPAGIFFVRIAEGDKVFVRKIIKVNNY
ncbi:MAG: T9SS type A sorting domain-containing protein [Bacteroidia bacterium]|nr:T9SS type A sorting domain-containing protein [Bacteroidia bacterium]